MREVGNVEIKSKNLMIGISAFLSRTFLGCSLAKKSPFFIRRDFFFLIYVWGIVYPHLLIQSYFLFYYRYDRRFWLGLLNPHVSDCICM